MNIDNLKILLRLNIKEFRYELLLLVLTGLASNYLLSLVGQVTVKNYDYFPLPLSIIKILLWIILYLLIVPVYPKIITIISTIIKNKYSFDRSSPMNAERFSKEWVSQGNVVLKDGGILISNSNSGCFINKRLVSRIWKNFTAEISVSFPSQNDPRLEKRIGILFRAQDFENYYMMEFYKDKGILKFRPHVRFMGAWDAPILDVDENMYKLKRNSFRITIKAKESVIKISINNNINTFVWCLPSHFETNLFIKAIKDKDKVEETFSKTNVPELSFKNLAGLFGFRAYGNQYAFISALKVKKDD